MTDFDFRQVPTQEGTSIPPAGVIGLPGRASPAGKISFTREHAAVGEHGRREWHVGLDWFGAPAATGGYAEVAYRLPSRSEYDHINAPGWILQVAASQIEGGLTAKPLILVSIDRSDGCAYLGVYTDWWPDRTSSPDIPVWHSNTNAWEPIGRTDRRGKSFVLKLRFAFNAANRPGSVTAAIGNHSATIGLNAYRGLTTSEIVLKVGRPGSDTDDSQRSGENFTRITRS